MLITVLLSLHYNQTENYQMERSTFIYALWSIWHLLWSPWKMCHSWNNRIVSRVKYTMTSSQMCCRWCLLSVLVHQMLIWVDLNLTFLVLTTKKKKSRKSEFFFLKKLKSLLSWLVQRCYHFALLHEHKGLLFLCGSVMDKRPVLGVPHISWWRHAPAPCDPTQDQAGICWINYLPFHRLIIQISHTEETRRSFQPSFY